MSYQKLPKQNIEDFDGMRYPVKNGERYPPIPLPPPENMTLPPPRIKPGDVIIINNVPEVSIANTSGSNANSVLDPESLHDIKNVAFNKESIRRGFIRKVYLILMVQILVTAGVIGFFLFHKPANLFAKKTPLAILLPCSLLNIGIVLLMDFVEEVRRHYPGNFLLLGLYTLSNSALLGCLSCYVDMDLFFYAALITTALCLILSLFAIQTKYDFTGCGGFILCSFVVLFIIGIVAIFWRSYVMNVTYSSIGALLACIYFIYDTQLIVGGEHKYAFNPEEYILAAMVLYMDITRILIFIIRIMLSSKRN